MILHLIRQDLLLRLVTMFEEFLNHIIAKNIRHQLYRVRVYLPEDLILLITVSGLQFLLNKPGAMLVATKLNDMVVNILGQLSECTYTSLILGLP